MKVKVGQKMYIGANDDGTLDRDCPVYTSLDDIKDAFAEGDVEEGYIFREVTVGQVFEVKAEVCLQQKGKS